MNPKNLEKNIISFLNQLSYKKYTLGLSGGVDSVVLFHILLKHKVDFNAVHVHHGLSDNANTWLSFCQTLCSQNNIEFISKKVSIQHENRKSLENEARIARYNVYSTISHLHDSAIILGHHNDDLIESMLLNLLNRTGLKGLSAMPSNYHNEQFDMPIVRPFLGNENVVISKEDIENYAAEESIRHIYDESNTDNAFSRNFLRNEIIPQLKDKFGNIGKPMAKTNKEAQAVQISEKEVNIFKNTQPALSMYEVQLDEHLNWKNILFSIQNRYKIKVKRDLADNLIQWVHGRKDNESHIELDDFIFFYQQRKLYVISKDYLEGLKPLTSSHFKTKEELLLIDKSLRSEINKLFKKNAHIRKNIPSIFRDSKIYLLDENNNLIMIGNFSVRERSVNDTVLTGHPCVDYFLVS